MSSRQIVDLSSRPLCITAQKSNPIDLAKAVSYSCEFDINQFQIDMFIQFKIAKPHSILTAVEKRQCEFFAGRYCARQALNSINCVLQQVPIGDNRAPIWPEGIVGSITHNDKTAICILAHQRDFLSLGIDIENWTTWSTAQSIRSAILTTNENRWLKEQAWPMTHTLTLLFSAKESLFKALYPEVKTFFDFSAASIVSINVREKKFVIKLEQKLSEKLPKGMKFEGNYQFFQLSVLTYIPVHN